jgi:predicted PurR-regulated permease PerM
VHEFEVYLIYPLVVRRAVGISPLIVILSLLVGLELGGFWGIILAIPVAVSLFEFLDDVEKEKAFAKTHEA